jgi:flagellar hook-length control protein FliK
VNRRLAVSAILAGALTGAPAAAADTAAADTAADTATADTAVVNATVFTGAAGTAAARTVTLSTLGGCPPYAGPGALSLYPGGSTDTLPAGTTWTLAEILQCGLSIPLRNLNAVEVLRPGGAAQAPLSPAALTDSSQYADLAAPGALPVISNDGGQAQNTYTRPWRGGGDENGRDQVTASGPVGLVVYENTAPLAVRIATRALRRGTHRERVALSATVQTSAGTPVPAGALGWQWTLSTGARSAAAAPRVTIPRGTATVTVLVSDRATGSGGTAGVALTYRPVRSDGPHSGGGGPGTVHSTSGLGSGHHPNHGIAHRHGQGQTASTATSTTTSATPTPAAPTPATSAPAAATTTTTTVSSTTATTTTSTVSLTTAAAATASSPTSTPARPPHMRRSPQHHSPALGGTLVRGELLADVVPLSASRSPRTHPVLDPQSAAVASPGPIGRLTVPAEVFAGIAVLGLLALGAAREQRRRWPRLHR